MKNEPRMNANTHECKNQSKTNQLGAFDLYSYLFAFIRGSRFFLLDLFWHKGRQQLLGLRSSIEDYLRQHFGLLLRPNKISFFPKQQGIDFLMLSFLLY